MTSEAKQKTCNCTPLAEATAAAARIDACMCGDNCDCGAQCGCATVDQGARACSCAK